MATTITINLRRKLVRLHTTRRMKKAIAYFKEELARHSRVDADSISISRALNKFLMVNVAAGLEPAVVVVEIDKDGAHARLANEPKEQKVSAPKKEEKAAEKKEQAKTPEQKVSAATSQKPEAQAGREKQQPGPKSSGDAPKTQPQ